MTDTPPPAPTRMPDPIAKVAIPEGPGARRYSFAVLAVALLLCAGAIATNVVVNPRSEFANDAFRPLVVDWVHESVERYEARDEPPQDLVVGSSRASLIRGLPGREDVTFTFYAAGSPPPDWLDAYRYVKREQGPPENLVVVVDQSAFTAVFSPRVPRSVDAEVVLGQPTSTGDQVALALRTLSVPYIQDSLHSLRLRYVGGYPPPPTADPDPVFARPGLMEAYRNGTFDPSEVDRAIDDQSERAFGAGHRKGEGYREALGVLLDEALADGVAVWAVMPPYQPVALADIEARFPAFQAERTAVREFLASFCPAVNVADATEVEDVGVDRAEFFDQSHLTPVGSDQLMQGVADGRADACAASAAAPS